MKRGMSLLEMVVCIGLLALVIPFVLNLIPSGSLALHKAEEVQAATATAALLIEEAGEGDLDEERGEFHVRRAIYQVDDRLSDVVVEVTPRRGAPVRLATRIRVDAP